MRQNTWLVVSLMVIPSLAMDFGGGGVWDSPMATDHYVRQFGWMFGGGRSGMAGMKALTSNRISKDDMKMSNPYEYDYDKNNRINLFPSPSLVVAAPHFQVRPVIQSRRMVKLAPLVMKGSDKKNLKFQPFMAVP